MVSLNKAYRKRVLLLLVATCALLGFHLWDFGRFAQLPQIQNRTAVLRHQIVTGHPLKSTPSTEHPVKSTPSTEHPRNSTPSTRPPLKSTPSTEHPLKSTATTRHPLKSTPSKTPDGLARQDQQRRVHYTNDTHTPRMTGLLVNSSGCQLPDFSPWDDTVLSLLREERPLQDCRQDYPVVLSQSGRRLTMKTRPDRLEAHCEPECCLRSVVRAREGRSDDHFQLADDTVCFEGRPSLTVGAEAVRVTCFCNATPNVTLYEDFRAFILPRATPSVTPPTAGARGQDRLNVYLIAIDSVSTLNFRRYMPNVQQLLKRDFDAVPMLGLTKVGSNTFPNLVALLAGLRMDQLNQSLRENPFDSQPMVWKQFSSLGYITMYAEDGPSYSTFNYHKKGFFSTPTDHYARPLQLAMQNSKLLSRGGEACVNDRLQFDMQLRWLQDFIAQRYPSPQFALIFSNAPSHKGPLTHIKVLQPPLLQFLRKYRDSPRYNSSILVLFSDHGMRAGPIMRTELGGYESRLPFFYIILPAWYQTRHPRRVASLRTNSRRLTTFFDVHATLRELLLDAGASQSDLPAFPNPGVSLFQPVPLERSCEDAGIAPHWCVCSTRQPLPPDSAAVARAANATVNYINTVLLHRVRPLCADLRLQRVMAAFVTLSMTGGEVDETVYRLEAFDELSVHLETTPGRAEFEATVRCYQGVPPPPAANTPTEQQDQLRTDGVVGLDARCRNTDRLVVMDVSRLNLYKGQSDCLTNFFDESRFCYCKNLL